MLQNHPTSGFSLQETADVGFGSCYCYGSSDPCWLLKSLFSVSSSVLLKASQLETQFESSLVIHSVLKRDLVSGLAQPLQNSYLFIYAFIYLQGFSNSISEWDSDHCIEFSKAPHKEARRREQCVFYVFVSHCMFSCLAYSCF